MKKLIIIVVLFLLAAVKTSNAQPEHGEVSFNYFYNTLSPYGQWIDVDNGLYAWKPYNVSPGWSPYMEGRWVWTNDGWYWDSYEPFGWAVYHYGRWYNDDYYGWMWIPDYQWGPSWVEWRYDNDYVGWAPLPPYAIFKIGIGIQFTYDWHFPYHNWNYVSINHFCDDHPYHYFVGDRYKYRIHERARYRDDFDYRDGHVINRGIDRDFIERRGRVKIAERDITVTRSRDAAAMRNNNGDRNRITVFRPDQNEVNRYRNTERINAKRIDRKISLDVNKVEIGARTRASREVVTPRPTERVDRQRDEVKRVEVSPNVQREVRKEEPRVIQAPPQRSVTPRVEPERRVVEQPKVENRNNVQENRSPRVEPRVQERRVEERKAPEVRREPQPQVREKRNEEPKRTVAPKRTEAPREDRRNSGGGERSRDRDNR